MKKNCLKQSLRDFVDIVIPMQMGIKIKNNKKYCAFIKNT